MKNLNETNLSLISRVLNEIGQKMIENSINATINMTTRDTKDGIADLIYEIMNVNKKVTRIKFLIFSNHFRFRLLSITINLFNSI